MTPKERVQTTIAHREPDRVPTGEYGGFGHEIVEPVLGPGTYRNTWATKHAFWEGRRNDVIQEWKTGLVKLTEHYQWDAILVHTVIDHETPIEAPEPIGDNQWRDRQGNVIQYSEAAGSFIPPATASCRRPSMKITWQCWRFCERRGTIVAIEHILTLGRKDLLV